MNILTPYEAAQRIAEDLEGTYESVVFDDQNGEYRTNPYVLHFVQITHNGKTVRLSVSTLQHVSVIFAGTKIRHYSTQYGWKKRVADLLAV